MAECVSCGKEIPAGKFFCEDCYTKMKGRRRPMGEVPRISSEKQKEPVLTGEASGEEELPQETAAPTGVVPVKKASGTLTPASSKKVVSMKPTTDRAAKEKAGKKRYIVTISFSERTYAALARLKVKGGKKAPAAKETAGSPQVAQAESGEKERGKEPNGRPQLKAVESSGWAPKRKRGFRGAVAYRDRPADRGDVVAIAMSTFAVLTIIVMSFLPWATISFGGQEGSMPQTVKVPGIDLGAITYICMALPVAALLYMVATWRFKGVFTIVDYGVVLMIAGVVFIPLYYVAISSNNRFVVAAMRQLGGSGSAIAAQFERQTLWPAYLMVLAGALLAFAGLVRLSERKSTVSQGD
jgi:hypothetical protein